MSNPNNDQQPPAARPASESEPCCGRDSVCEGLRTNIRRLQSELAERDAQARPMPSSVMRAYQKLIDRQLSELAEQEQNNP